MVTLLGTNIEFPGAGGQRDFTFQWDMFLPWRQWDPDQGNFFSKSQRTGLPAVECNHPNVALSFQEAPSSNTTVELSMLNSIWWFQPIWKKYARQIRGRKLKNRLYWGGIPYFSPPFGTTSAGWSLCQELSCAKVRRGHGQSQRLLPVVQYDEGCL